jgi:peptidoglycan-associated lipoprotein
MVLTLAVLVSFAACAKKPKPEESSIPGGAAADENIMGDSDNNKAMGLQTVHFPYDSFTLNTEAKSVLKSNADILKEKPSLKIQIEGHCDQRGGIQYNIALGEKRANATKNYIVDMGVKADRITTISYGKERPIDSAMNEDAFAKNRRANFVITSK